MMRFLPFAALVLIALPLAAQQPSLMEHARAALDHNDPDTAASLLEQAVAQAPNNAEAHYLLGTAYGQQAEKASIFRRASLARKTRDEFERAVALDPNHLDARYSLVQYYMEAPSFMGGDEGKARTQAAEIARRNVEYGHLANAFIAKEKKDFTTATAELHAALAIDPNDKEALEMLRSIGR